MVRAELFDQGEQADDCGAPAHQDNIENKDHPNEETKPLVQGEDKAIGAGFEPLFRGKRQHHLRAGHANQVRYRDELIALGAQSVDDLGKGGDRLRTFTPSIMKKDDVALVRLAQDAGHDVFRGQGILAVGHAPIIRVDALPHDQITHVLGKRKLRHFFRVFRLMIDAIRRTEENGLHSQSAFNQALRQI